jgi:quinol monooxygenase YgiN
VHTANLQQLPGIAAERSRWSSGVWPRSYAGLTVLHRQVARVNAEEPGIQLFAAHEADEGFVLIEKWASDDSLQAHINGDAITDFREVLFPSLIKPAEIHVLNLSLLATSQRGSLASLARQSGWHQVCSMARTDLRGSAVAVQLPRSLSASSEREPGSAA